MIKVFLGAQEFGKVRYDNGFVPVPVTYPKANEQIYELFTQRYGAMTEIMRGLRANMMAEEVGVDKVSSFPADDIEATARLEDVDDIFKGAENVERIFGLIMKAYEESATEGPVSPADMRDLSEFDS